MGRWPTAMFVLVFAMSVAGAEDTVIDRWDFDQTDATALIAHGDVQRDQAGPVPPQFPDFAAHNTAVSFGPEGGYLAIADAVASQRLAFTNGDAITIEAWINVAEMKEGQNLYVIGKGRTGSANFPRDNQNWGMRVVGRSGAVRVSFLFATALSDNGSHWHRWISNDGFAAGSGWRHIAVTYRFGEPKTVKGWIDGKATIGKWDMGGATNKPPVVDDDAVWIGSALGGDPGNSFVGDVDSLAVHRVLLADEVLTKRFNRVGEPRVGDPVPEAMPEFAQLPEGNVLVTFTEGLATHTRWPFLGEEPVQEAFRWLGDAFLLPRIPQRYDDWGIRASWKAPVMIRMAADVKLPLGRHTFLLRARALSRLWVNGQAVARTEPMMTQPPNGEEPMTPLAEPPLPGTRVKGYRQQEVSGEIEIETDGLTRVVLETVTGGKNYRTETGETSVAVLSADGQAFDLLTANGVDGVPLTDAVVGPLLARIEADLSAYDDARRRNVAASQEAFWNKRHDAARDWVAAQPPTPHASIDAFINATIDRVTAEAASSDLDAAHRFHDVVLPILREECFRCHGDKDKGGLRLHTREAALEGGDSGSGAVVPGDPVASDLIVRVATDDKDERMPPTDDGLEEEQVAALREWIRSGANWPARPVTVKTADLIDDGTFLRRIFFDTVGVPPNTKDIESFLSDTQPDKRERLIDHMIDDERYADNWMGFWQDMLAENPTLINPSLNSTGPFRWFIYDALRDNKPLDRMVTELILMRGAAHEGGSAGFALAAENDAPFAAKGHIVASAFLGIELQCARCHDSPYHSTTQRDLFSLAAMLERKPVKVPASSAVPAVFFENLDREPLIQVTLQPDEPIEPDWPFAAATGASDGTGIDSLMNRPDDDRERLATLVTAPENTRFPQVMVNRLWKRLFGAGIVEPVQDWEGKGASHPKLLAWLGRELVKHDYDLKHVLRLMMKSEAYQREAVGANLTASVEDRFFNAPDRRRLTAEQVVDAMHAVASAPIDSEELTFVHDGRRAVSNRLTLGMPTRAWMFASLANERDRPSLNLPRAQAVADVLAAFGWTGARQKPIAERESEPHVLQPGVLANGALAISLTRASDGSTLAQLAVDASSPDVLLDQSFLRILSRRPTEDERLTFAPALAEGFEARLLRPEEMVTPKPSPELPLVTWFNHLQSEANSIQIEHERRVQQGPPPDRRLRPAWREVYEDVTWSLMNHREFVWIP
jgi:mono/diheme cytochrome c family protein